MDKQLKYELEKLAAEIRIATVETLAARGFGHIGGSLSIADALAVLYGGLMRVDPKDPALPERDKLVCSKGHAGPAVYAALAIRGYFPREELKTLNRPGTKLPSHCDRNKTPGVDMTTGSLGQGSSLACGMALGDRLMGRDSKTYLILGDGECDEGQVWEAAMFASDKKLSNMVWLIDWNKKQLDGPVKEILDTLDFEEKFRAFGFDAVTVDGNDVEALYEAMTKQSDKPIAVVMDTVKGKGIREVEETLSNHSMTEDAEVFDRWIAGLKADRDRLLERGAEA
ncbi:MAG: transketolase [Oscillospiraceae bacterium]|nr:transketolase [Oscillospiraceae bacterium]